MGRPNERQRMIVIGDMEKKWGEEVSKARWDWEENVRRKDMKRWGEEKRVTKQTRRNTSDVSQRW